VVYELRLDTEFRPLKLKNTWNLVLIYYNKRQCATDRMVSTGQTVVMRYHRTVCRTSDHGKRTNETLADLLARCLSRSFSRHSLPHYCPCALITRLFVFWILLCYRNCEPRSLINHFTFVINTYRNATTEADKRTYNNILRTRHDVWPVSAFSRTASTNPFDV